MGKRGMKRPERTHTQTDRQPPVPELQGGVKSGKKKAGPVPEA